MLKELSLWLTGFILFVFWLNSLIDFNSYGGPGIPIDDNSLFIGFSILLAAWVITINLPSSQKTARLSSDYVKFITAIGSQSLTLDQLAEKIGEDSLYIPPDSKPAELKKALSDAQQRSLRHLIFDGKISFRDDQYSLPDQSNPA